MQERERWTEREREGGLFVVQFVAFCPSDEFQA